MSTPCSAPARLQNFPFVTSTRAPSFLHRNENPWHSAEQSFSSLIFTRQNSSLIRTSHKFSCRENRRTPLHVCSSLAEHKKSETVLGGSDSSDNVRSGAENSEGSSGNVSSVQQPTDGNVLKPDCSDITEWELDFCSRPILDVRGKRVWELLVCDNSRRLQFAEYFPSNKINSATLKDALLKICELADAPKPQKIRFFRAQMATIISKSCAELDIQPVPSQRCVTLVQWLNERYAEVYPKEPGYQPSAVPLLQLETPPPQNLPDNLRGEKWAFVQLPLSAIEEEMKRVKAGEMFGAVFDLSASEKFSSLSKEVMVPGVAVASSRAMPLAAWTSSLELACLRIEPSKACLILNTGVSDSWNYAYYRKSPGADAEARAWEKAKAGCGGLHFLAVQRDMEEEECAGFWLLLDEGEGGGAATL